ncbi:conserved hypothetical protein [Ricinus communis]|uniref:Uncharacterized protein n=1 Tax=Ricinus communis TaxID=3988 RepID=B9SRM9_RICCO|nr:conserved hypothetical protein [Ricinus communis]
MSDDRGTSSPNSMKKVKEVGTSRKPEANDMDELSISPSSDYRRNSKITPCKYTAISKKYVTGYKFHGILHNKTYTSFCKRKGHNYQVNKYHLEQEEEWVQEFYWLFA